MPEQFKNFGRALLALVLGALAGFALNRFNIPLAWMIGAMLATALAALVRLPVASPAILRPSMKAVVGAMMGASIGPDIFARLGTWAVPLAGLLVANLIGAVLAYHLLQRVARLDASTAFLAAMPGGMVEMTLLADEFDADARAIAVIQALRIFTVVLLMPFLLAAFGGLAMFSIQRTTGFDIAGFEGKTLVWLAACIGGGIALGRLLRLPAADLFGPMLVSAVLHMSGLTVFKVPPEIVAAAQVVLGVGIGARFIGILPAALLKLSLQSSLVTGVHLALAIAGALLVGHLVPIDAKQLLLAYAPGGLTEMSLIAIALGADLAFVATHHLVRVVAVIFFAPLAIAKIGIVSAKS